MTFPRIHIGRPQQMAALLLFLFLTECFWVIHRQEISTGDYRYARCGREMWERPSPLAGYFTSCGNLNGDGTFAYRLAAFPLTAQRLVLLLGDRFRAPENRVYANGSLNGSTWEARHEIADVKWLMHVPFALFAAWLGAGLWWVSRRLFGSEGGFLALALYCFCPEVVLASVHPNNDVLAMWGLYGVVYTAMGVAHALQGPRHKWKPRIALLSVALGLTAAAHLLAGLLGLFAAAIFMLYLAEYRRGYVVQILIMAGVGALLMQLAFFGFHVSAFTYVFTGGAARFWFSLEAVRAFGTSIVNAGILNAAGVALLLFVAVRRSRYFGNAAPLIVALALCTVYTTQIRSSPLLWALPFLFTFIGGVFADALETRYRKLFLALAALVVVAQAGICLAALPSIR
jgi:hypothetical protein